MRRTRSLCVYDGAEPEEEKEKSGHEKNKDDEQEEEEAEPEEEEEKDDDSQDTLDLRTGNKAKKNTPMKKAPNKKTHQKKVAKGKGKGKDKVQKVHTKGKGKGKQEPKLLSRKNEYSRKYHQALTLYTKKGWDHERAKSQSRAIASKHVEALFHNDVN